MFYARLKVIFLKEDVTKKYIKDLDGLLKELLEWRSEPPNLNEIYHDAVVFIFGRIFKFLIFDDIYFGRARGLDALVVNKELTMYAELEVFSSHFKRHIRKGDVKADEYRDVLLICWKHNWNECPSDIDVLELRHFWEMAS